MTYPGQPVSKNLAYGLGQWHPDPALHGGYAARFSYLKERKLIKGRGLIVLKGIPSLLLLVSGIVDTNFYPNILLWGGVIGTFLWTFRYFTEYKWLRNGHPVEGLITAVSEDGIDRLYTIYYQPSSEGYEILATQKVKSKERKLQPGDHLTLFLGKNILTTRLVAIFPRESEPLGKA